MTQVNGSAVKDEGFETLLGLVSGMVELFNFCKSKTLTRRLQKKKR